MTPEEIIQYLDNVRAEAEQARAGGLNPRDTVWDNNIDAYWGRYDFSHKEEWQAKEVMPEVPAFVDRFAAALKEALIATRRDFYTFDIPGDDSAELARSLKRATDVWLGRLGTGPNGSILPFEAVFEDSVKIGALMACSGLVRWDDATRRVVYETVDPRSVWLDHTGRGLYRLRSYEVDPHELEALATVEDEDGKPLYDPSTVGAAVMELAADRQRLSGAGEPLRRRGMLVEEFYGTLVDSQGRLFMRNALVVVAEKKHVIRGPEPNPFWHGQDWVLFAPLVRVPLSPYGRSYLEDISKLAVVYTEMTNLLIDAAKAAALRIYVVVPELLANPEEDLADGLYPGKVLRAMAGVTPDGVLKDFAAGGVDPAAVQVWQLLKNELTEAAGLNEVGLGQFAPRGRTSATEVQLASANSAAIVRSVAATLELTFLAPLIDRVWKTGLQHARRDDTALRAAVGAEAWERLHRDRRGLVQAHISIEAAGLSALIQRSAQLSQLLQALQVIAASPELLAAFGQMVDPAKFLDYLLFLSNIDPKAFTRSERERMQQEIMQAAALRAAPQAGEGAQAAVAQLLGGAIGAQEA